MGGRDDELGLSLSLGFGVTTHMQRPSNNSMHNHLRKSSWNEHFQFSDRNADSRSFLRGIDVNRLPTGMDGEEENGVSSPNSTISSISGKRSEREAVGDEAEAEAEAEAERASCSRGSDDEDGGGGDGDASRKKLRLSKEQSMVLEETFKEHNTLNPKQKLALAKQLNLRPRQVEVWFQNRRARTKLKQTEVDCEYLKRCCENLTEENRRLQKEVQELRALKLSPQLYMHMNPPTTLTMCPQCERVAVSSSSSTSAATTTRHPAAGGVQRHSVAINPWAVLPIQR
ncbi:homeobox-leucine zipper protein HAT3 [Benincasa hispida]|uniref:homeobox-leucine zipper protein HAT3 n=1 Tax=Benincasa hispida TaxID=102211 RepID=UPI001900648E|nr:homeobox-leucine zipper protein HAT3 [Benincasa hispida]